MAPTQPPPKRDSWGALWSQAHRAGHWCGRPAHAAAKCPGLAVIRSASPWNFSLLGKVHGFQLVIPCHTPSLHFHGNFPWNKPSSYGGTPMTMGTPPTLLDTAHIFHRAQRASCGAKRRWQMLEEFDEVRCSNLLPWLGVAAHHLDLDLASHVMSCLVIPGKRQCQFFDGWKR